jgi:indole-3-glycerol phosphate synthase
MTSFLEKMAESSYERVRAAGQRESFEALARRASAAPAPLPLKLAGFDLIAELKLRSPAAGALTGRAFDARRQLEAYANGGAAAVSVLTEPLEFRGELAHLEAAAAQLRPRAVPVMRKDFLVDARQILEARAAGASGVLLIAAMLSDAALEDLLAAAAELGLFVLLEAFDAADLERIAALKLPTARIPVLVGVNSRDLRTLAVDFSRFAALAGQIRRDVPAVAESGIDSEVGIETVAAGGYQLALVGSALMREGDSRTSVAAFIATGRAAAARRAAAKGSATEAQPAAAAGPATTTEPECS